MEPAVQTEDIRKKLDDYKEIIIRFADLLRKENQALSEYDTFGVSEMYEQKAQIVTVYRSLVAFFLKNQQILQTLLPEEKQQLRENTQQLDELMQKNKILLQTRMETSKSVIGSIVNAAKMMSNTNSTAYGARGNYSPINTHDSAIAINRTL